MINLRFRFGLLFAAMLLCCSTDGWARKPDVAPGAPNGATERLGQQPLGHRSNCRNSTSTKFQNINNVRALLTTGGDVWWDGTNGKYIVPNVPAGEPEVSSLYAGAVWLGGLDPAGNLKVAAQQYGRSRGNGDFDYYSGPLDPEGITSEQVCAQWDTFFVVTAAEILEHQRLFRAAQAGEINYTVDMIPRGVRGWPSRGNPYFQQTNNFPLPNNNEPLAGFYEYCDENGDCNVDNVYDPLQGDYPIIEIEKCLNLYDPDPALRDMPQFADEMFFWIYNDNGNQHRNSGSQTPLQMEVQVQSFAYSTNDALNNMTFQRYRLINRGKELLRETFFGMWVDGDLGCAEDDYIGCDTTRSLGYYYNVDAIDGITGSVCGGVPTYGDQIPLIGIDYFRGPNETISIFGPDSMRTDTIVELGMSSFTYFVRRNTPGTPDGMQDPTEGRPVEFYNLLSGSWKDGTPYTAEGRGYQTNGAIVKYAFPSPPRETGSQAWSCCSESLGEADRRTIQASGPFTLAPATTNELIIGVPWVADEDSYPCPIMTRLFDADDLAQNLFDNCFNITDGPDAPDVDIIELDQKLTLVLTNDDRLSNNAFQRYAEVDLLAPRGVADSVYRFEGYKVFQIRTPDVTDFDDPQQARLVFQADIRNGVGEIFNWNEIRNPLDPTRPIFEPEAQVESGSVDQGIRTVFTVTTDQFAQGNNRLLNHKPYYFKAVTYAYNNYQDFDPFVAGGTGQPRPYLEGRRNVRAYVGVPRPIINVRLNGEGKAGVVRRLDGVGTSDFFLDLASGERERLFEDQNAFNPLYQEGRAPIVARVFNPFISKNGTYRVIFSDRDMSDDVLAETGTWRLLKNTPNGDSVVISNQDFSRFNELVIGKLGISIQLGNVFEPGNDLLGRNGCIGYEVASTAALGEEWYNMIPNKFGALSGVFGGDEIFNFIRTDEEEPDFLLDPNKGLTECFNGEWQPFALTTFTNDRIGQLGFLSPMLRVRGSGLRSQLKVADLNNVDIVFTPDKSKWSRCVILESAFAEFTAPANASLPAEGGARAFELRNAPSVGKEAGSDGLPQPDGDGNGMGWFPGYAIDVETGQRLNIFFSENSAITKSNGDTLGNPYLNATTGNNQPVQLTGRDMMFNPTPDLIVNAGGGGGVRPLNIVAGGQHFVYVTRERYDSCATMRDLFVRGRGGIRDFTYDALVTTTYAGLMLPQRPFNSYAEGLIPSETVVKLRVANPYQVATGPQGPDDRVFNPTTNFNQGYPAYEFTLEGVEAEDLTTTNQDSILSFINVVPNPYYGYSEYEISEFSNLIRITNLPARAIVTIYTLDGKFIRRYTRAEEPQLPFGSTTPLNNRGVVSRQIYPSLDWDMKNGKGIPVASGVYLIHVDAGELGERTLKSFIIQRAFDPAGL